MSVGPGNPGDFKNKQFAEDKVVSKVVEPYDAEQARTIYTYVMNGDELDIH